MYKRTYDNKTIDLFFFQSQGCLRSISKHATLVFSFHRNLPLNQEPTTRVLGAWNWTTESAGRILWWDGWPLPTLCLIRTSISLPLSRPLLIARRWVMNITWSQGVWWIFVRNPILTTSLGISAHVVQLNKLNLCFVKKTVTERLSFRSDDLWNTDL